MTRFVQLHLLTAYPPANLNRDDLGRPKTAVFGGATRLRLSSQSLKRAIRTSDGFKAALDGHLGQRTQRFGELVEKHLIWNGISEEKAKQTSITIARFFGKIKADKNDEGWLVEQLVFIAPEERERALDLALEMANGRDVALKDGPQLALEQARTAVDIAMFGRMLTDETKDQKVIVPRARYTREAAVQVAHGITTHKCIVEDDYYTALDELADEPGAGFIGEAGFGAGVFYLYACVDRPLLERNLGGDAGLAGRGLDAFVRAAATSGPKGKQASFASRAVASYGLVEKGDATPRTLAAAFLRPVNTDEAGGDLLRGSIARLTDWRAGLARAYGEDNAGREMDVAAGAGTLADLAAFAADPG